MRRRLPVVLSLFLAFSVSVPPGSYAANEAKEAPEVFRPPLFAAVADGKVQPVSLGDMVNRKMTFPEGFADTARVEFKIPYTITKSGKLILTVDENQEGPLREHLDGILSELPKKWEPALDRSATKIDYEDTLRILYQYPVCAAATGDRPLPRPLYRNTPSGLVKYRSKPVCKRPERNLVDRLGKRIEFSPRVPDMEGWFAYRVTAERKTVDLSFDPALPEQVCEAIRSAIGGEEVWSKPALDWQKRPVDYCDTVHFSIRENLILNDSLPETDEAEPDQLPKFEGGSLGAFRGWVMARIRYPQSMAARKISGTVVFAFVIDTEGRICDISLLQAPHMDLANEVVRILGLSPKWTPGIQHGKPVRVRYTLPIKFSIR